MNERRMTLPEDWDQPDPGNEALCQQFEKHRYEEHGCRLFYRIFSVKTEEQLPIVLYLHGADAVGDDNELPLSMHDIGTMFAKAQWQRRHPCHILAPQYHRGQHWSVPKVGTAVMDLLQREIGRLHADPDRIYIYGYSAGGVGTLRLLKENPKVFAAGISICGATGKSDLDALKDKPLWLVHAADDGIVKASYQTQGQKELFHFGSRDLYELLADEAQKLRYTEYPAGYMKAHYGVNPHCSWVAVSDEKNQEFGNWLFQQKRLLFL